MTDLTADGPIEKYLDELFDRLSGTGAAGRRSLAEAEDHLREAAAVRIAAGTPSLDAEREAVASFGSPLRIATGLAATHRSLGSLIGPAFVGAWWIGIVATLALGLSGLLSEVLGRVFGADFVAGDAQGVTYTPARCADYFEYFPHAGSCNAAAALHHWGEVVDGRVVLGLLGLVALAAWAVARRRLVRTRPSGTLVAVVTTAMAGVVAAVLLGLTLMEIAFGVRTGVGANLADGSAAALVTLGAAWWGVHRMRRPRVA